MISLPGPPSHLYTHRGKQLNLEHCLYLILGFLVGLTGPTQKNRRPSYSSPTCLYISSFFCQTRLLKARVLAPVSPVL